MDPVEDMHIRSDAFTAIVGRLASLQERIAESPVHTAADKDARYAAFQDKVSRNILCCTW